MLCTSGVVGRGFWGIWPRGKLGKCLHFAWPTTLPPPQQGAAQQKKNFYKLWLGEKALKQQS